MKCSLSDSLRKPMNKPYYTKRKGRNPLRKSAFSHPVNAYRRPGKPDNNTISSISNTLRHYRRCFSELDRITGYFDGGPARSVETLQYTDPLLHRCRVVYASWATFKAFWQKSRRVRPLNDNSGPVREDDQEKALSTRTYGSDQGKAVAMVNIQ